MAFSRLAYWSKGTITPFTILIFFCLVTAISAAETCTSYTDGTGFARSAFDCDDYCCGTSTYKYCCTEYCSSTYFTGGSCTTQDAAWNSVGLVAGILAGVVAAAAVFLVVAMVCEKFCNKSKVEEIKVDLQKKERVRHSVPNHDLEQALEEEPSPGADPEPQPEPEPVPESQPAQEPPQPEPQPEAEPIPEPFIDPERTRQPRKMLVRRGTLPPIPGPQPVGELHPNPALPNPPAAETPPPPRDIYGGGEDLKYGQKHRPRPETKGYVDEALDY